MTRLLAFALLAGCAPIAAGPLAAPLPELATTSVDLSATSARFGSLRQTSTLPDPLPQVQLHASSTIRLTDDWEAGPSFVLNMGQRGSPERVTGGLFVRYWTTEDDADLLAAVRVEAGWGWGGVGLDLAFPVAEDATVMFGPTALATPELIAVRLPVGVVAHIGALDLGVEGGALAGSGRSVRRLVPWLGIRLRLTLPTQ